LIYLAFFASGVSGLIYQVVWVRAFGNVFGNTIYSASIVVAVFMLGLGVGSRVIGAWADRRYASAPGSLLRAYGHAELAIALLGFIVSMTVPHVGTLAALFSFYSQGADGWYVPSLLTYAGRVGITVVLLLPITILMGGTLTLLIRHLVRHDISVAPERIAGLYAANTVGAALGCFLTDFALIPAAGLLRTQMIAVVLNAIAGIGALALAAVPRDATRVSSKARGSRRSADPIVPPKPHSQSTMVLVSVALGLTGFAALGMEILWFRHATILLGGFRAVFALLLTVVLTGIAIGAYAGGALARRTPQAASWLMVAQAMFAMTAVAGMFLPDASRLEAAVNIATRSVSPLDEIWFNVTPLLALAGIPSILMGVSFPLANALVQQAESLVARRAGGLYFANTAGAVCGSIATGFLLLPWLGIQWSAAILTAASALAIAALYLCSRTAGGGLANAGPYASLSLLTTAAAVAACVIAPHDFVIRRAIGNAAEARHVLAQREGLTEVVTIADTSDGRLLLTNGHAMSSTAWLSQRYMRALAHIPLLMLDNPASVLVIGFGAGNTTHAATLHPSLRRLEIADLSRTILEHASYFESANQRVLKDRRVHVFVNDGRQHLQIQPPDTYDLITLEPPPIAYAGVAALYSKEFYELARSRLTARGFVSQWLPTYQVPRATALSMIRAFADVFPQSVLLSGAQADLLLIGTAGPTIELDPARIASALMTRRAVRGDLEGLDMGSVREIAGTFVGSARTLREATANVRPVTDDWPSTEYSVLSALNPGEDVPGNVVTLERLPEWCPQCFANGQPVATVAGLDVYMRLMDLAYRASPADGVRLAQAAKAKAPDRRAIAGSAYLGAIVPESAELYNVTGVDYAARGAMREAILLFRKAVEIDPNSAPSHWHLGAALAQTGAREEAIRHLQRSIDLDPGNHDARADLDAVKAASGIR
jgi:spermidine synthase